MIGNFPLKVLPPYSNMGLLISKPPKRSMIHDHKVGSPKNVIVSE